MELFENSVGSAIKVMKDADLNLFAMRFDTSSSCEGISENDIRSTTTEGFLTLV
jgi:hypothetical protein